MDTFFLFPKGVCLGADHLTFERVWVISEKKYPADWFWRKKFLKEVPGEKNIFQGVQSWKNKSYTVVCQEKNFISRGLGEKILTHTKSPIPRLKRQMVGALRELWP